MITIYRYQLDLVVRRHGERDLLTVLGLDDLVQLVLLYVALDDELLVLVVGHDLEGAAIAGVLHQTLVGLQEDRLVRQRRDLIGQVAQRGQVVAVIGGHDHEAILIRRIVAGRQQGGVLQRHIADRVLN